MTDDDILAQIEAARSGELAQQKHPSDKHYVERCRLVDRATGTLLMLTRDVGLQAIYKHPLLDRGFHLSLSFFEPDGYARRPFDDVAAADIIERVFGAHAARTLWVLQPTEKHLANHLRHFYQFCGVGWQALNLHALAGDQRDALARTTLIEAGARAYCAPARQEATA